MNVFDKAKEAAKKLKEEEAKEAAKRKAEAEYDAQHCKSLNEQVNEALNSFHGKKGIKREGDRLVKKGQTIAKMSVGYEKWENPNYDYKVEEEGYVIRWEVYDERGNVRMTGCSLDSFAEYIAVWLK